MAYRYGETALLLWTVSWLSSFLPPPSLGSFVPVHRRLRERVAPPAINLLMRPVPTAGGTAAVGARDHSVGADGETRRHGSGLSRLLRRLAPTVAVKLRAAHGVHEAK